MNDEDRAKVVAAAQAYLIQFRPADMSWWAPAVLHYGPADEALSNTILKLADLPMYAFFEVLKQRAPEEAKRLGIQ